MTSSGAAAAAALSTDDCRAIEQQLARGAPWDACDRFREALGRHADDPLLHYWGAMAHARAGAPARARGLLDRAEVLNTRGDKALREQMLSLRGRLDKDRLVPGGDPARTLHWAARALAHYQAAFALRGDPYPGINAASMAWLAGDEASARALARAVATRLASAAGPHDLWHHATAGEAALLLGDEDAAIAGYDAAWRAAAGDDGSVARMRAQLQLLLPVLPRAAALLERLPTPTVLAFAGHMVDAPGRTVPRFPPGLAPAVTQALADRLVALHRPIVYSSAACGADLLMLEAALAAGAEVNLVLPFARDDFVRLSVAVGGADWVPRFERVLSQARRVIMATDEGHLGDDVLFEHAARLVEGLAALRAAQLVSRPTLLVLLASGGPGAPLVGGTQASVMRWRQRHGEPEVVDLDALRRAQPPDSMPPAVPGSGAPDPGATHGAAHRHTRSLKTLLFADVKGFSRVGDAHAPAFHSVFLGNVVRCIDAAARPPAQVNTWGDALYAVFDEVLDGARFAWALLQHMNATDWAAEGLPPDSRIRIGLHTGPVFCGHDPVIGRDNHFGRSVTQAARIEPMAQPGTVYASEAFAATLAGEPGHGFTVEYLGLQPLPKGYGEQRLYRLDRSDG